MSQKDQEAAIDEKIERIRRKNEEIKRRHLEVEADKLNAEKLNAAVKFTPSENKNTDRKSFSRPLATNRNPRFEKKIPSKSYTASPLSHGKKTTNFTDGDGPPPDPVYTFLSDHSRDQPKGDYSADADANAMTENASSDEFRGQRGRGRGRGWNRGRGSPMRGSRRGSNSGNQLSRQGPQLQPEYQAWRAEREKIDQDRITRQRTAEGNWRREWDSEKLSQDENQGYQVRTSFSKKKKRDIEDVKIQRTVTNELAAAASPSKVIESRCSDKSVKSDYHSKGIPVDKKSVAFSFSKGASSSEINDDDLEEQLGFEHRNIISCGDSIKISLSNKPIRSVKVNPVNAAGTGRVGPRQKPLLSYSSQSEDEKELHAPIFHRRVPSTLGPKMPAPLPPRDEASAKKPPLPPSLGICREFGSPKKKPVVTKGQPITSKKEVESPSTERKELSRESSHENISEGGDDSWEDVATTSGNESADCSDADITKKPDISDKSIPRETNLVDNGMEETFRITGSSNRECGTLVEGGSVGPEELSEQTDVLHDEIDEETEMQRSKKNCEAAGEDAYTGTDVATVEKLDKFSIEIVEEPCNKGISTVNKTESADKEEVPQCTREEIESPGEVGGPESKGYSDEDKEKGSNLTPDVEPNVSIAKIHEENEPDLPESQQKNSDTQELKVMGTEGNNQTVEDGASCNGSVDKEEKLPENKDGSNDTSLRNDNACTPTI